MGDSQELHFEVCPDCGKRHTPNGTNIGELAGMPMLIDCNQPPGHDFHFVEGRREPQLSPDDNIPGFDLAKSHAAFEAMQSEPIREAELQEDSSSATEGADSADPAKGESATGGSDTTTTTPNTVGTPGAFQLPAPANTLTDESINTESIPECPCLDPDQCEKCNRELPDPNDGMVEVTRPEPSLPYCECDVCDGWRSGVCSRTGRVGKSAADRERDKLREENKRLRAIVEAGRSMAEAWKHSHGDGCKCYGAEVAFLKLLEETK